MGDFEGVGRLLQSEARKVFEFDQFGLAGVVGGKAVESLVHREQCLGVLGGRRDIEARGIGADLGQWPPVSYRALASGIVDEDPAHAFGGRCKEMGPVSPSGLLVATQPEPRLVNEGCGTQGLPGILSRHLGGRQAPQLLVNQVQQSCGSLRVVGMNPLQD